MLDRLFCYLYNLKHGIYFDNNGYRLTEFPITVHIELTNACNLACSYCPRTVAMKRSVGFMERELFHKIIDEGVRFGLRKIHLCMFGEPLMHPEIISFIEYAKTSGVRNVGLGTNASFLTKDISFRLIELGTDVVHICLDGAKKDTYEKLRQGANYDLVVENVENLVELIKRKNSRYPCIYLNIIESENTKDELKQFIKRWDRVLEGIPHSKSYVKRYTTFGGQVQSCMTERRAKSCNFRVPCFRLKDEVGIFWNGDVTTCCYDVDSKLKVGSLKENTLREIWYAGPLSHIRTSHIKGKLEYLDLCRECEATKYHLTPYNITRTIVTFLKECRDKNIRTNCLNLRYNAKGY